MKRSTNTTRHTWENDVCIHCRIKRRPRPLTKHLVGFGKYLYDYFVESQWVAQAPECVPKK